MRSTAIRTARALTCVSAAVAFALLPATVSSADIGDHVGGGEGSLNDVQNIANAAFSDALAAPLSEVGYDLQNLVLSNAASATSHKGCNGYTTRPAERGNPGSYTLRDIFVTLHAECWGGDNNFRVTIRIERSRWYGWQELAARTTEDNGSNPWYYHRDLTTSCRAGTWSYRNRADGGWGGYYGQLITQSYRTTCTSTNDVGFIDVS